MPVFAYRSAAPCDKDPMTHTRVGPEKRTTKHYESPSLKWKSTEELKMAKCEVCGNDYDNALEITVAGESHVFDSFECAIQGLAPTCPHCGCRVIGHGVEEKGQIFCCVHCARAAGPTELRDHA